MPTALPYVQDFNAPGYTLAADGWYEIHSMDAGGVGVDGTPALRKTDEDGWYEAFKDFAFTDENFCVEVTVKFGASVSGADGIITLNGGSANIYFRLWYGGLALWHGDAHSENLGGGTYGSGVLITQTANLTLIEPNSVHTFRVWGKTSALTDDATHWPYPDASALPTGEIHVSMDGVPVLFDNAESVGPPPAYFTTGSWREQYEYPARVGIWHPAYIAADPTLVSATHYLARTLSLSVGDHIEWIDDVKVNSTCVFVAPPPVVTDGPPADVTKGPCNASPSSISAPPSPPPLDNPIMPGVTDACAGTGLGPNGTNPGGGEVWVF